MRTWRRGVETGKSESEAENTLGTRRSSKHRTETAKSSDQSVPLSKFHRSVGNQTIKHLCENGDVQAKLAVSQPTDRAEREADIVADEVLSKTDSESTNTLGAEVQRTLSDSTRQTVDSETEHRIRSIQHGGKPLPKSIRSSFEPRFGWDFSNVRIHTGTEAHGWSRSINAEAFTTGNHIFFAHGNFAPESRAGRQLLAHELTHVIQQHRSAGIDRINRQQTSSGPEKAGDNQKRSDEPLNWDVVDGELSEREQVRLELYVLQRHRAAVERILNKGRITQVTMNDFEGIVKTIEGPGPITNWTTWLIRKTGEGMEKGPAGMVFGTLSIPTIWSWLAPTLLFLGNAFDPIIGIIQNAYHAIEEAGDDYVLSEEEMRSVKRTKQMLDDRINELQVKLNELVDRPMRPSSGHVP